MRKGAQRKLECITNHTKWILGLRQRIRTLTSMQCRYCRTIAGGRKGNLFQFDVAKVESLDIQVETREVYV